MVIEQIDIGGVALLEAKNDPPVGANGDAPIAGEVASQRVQPPARQIKVARLRRLVETRQHARDLVGVLNIHLAAVVIFIEASKASMTKPPDHLAMVW